MLGLKIIICRLFENPQFIVKIETGKASKIAGITKPGFIADCNEIAARNEIEAGFIYSVKGKYDKYILKASNEISKELLQQFRNTFGLYH